MNNVKTVIMAGGRGTRLASLTKEVPKPLVQIAGIPILEHEIMCLRENGFTDIILTVSHLSEKICNYFGDGTGISPITHQSFGVHIEYFMEEQPLGTAGALFQLQDKLTEDFLLLNADSYFDIDFKTMLDFHRKKGGLATILTHPNDHPYDSGLIVADEVKKVEKWFAKEDERPTYYKNRVNAGVYVISRKMFYLKENPCIQVLYSHLEKEKNMRIDLDRDLLKPLAASGRLFCYDSVEYVKDMGTIERLKEVETDVLTGIPGRKKKDSEKIAVFLDRDGTLNRHIGFLKDTSQLELLPGVAQAVKEINKMGYLAIVITNQPVIARGELTREKLQEIHNKLEVLLGEKGAYLDDIYYCPHHPDKGFHGEISELKIDCDCRKPKPGLLLQAAKDFHINLGQSWMVGDSKSDIEAGKAAGCKTVLVANDNNYEQDETSISLLEFVENVLKKEG